MGGNGAALPRMAPQSPAAPAPPVPAAPLPALPASPAASPRSRSTGTRPGPLPAALHRPPLTFGAPGLVSRAGYERAAFLSPFAVPSRSPPTLPPPPAWKRGVRAAGRCRVSRNGAGRAVLGTSSHVSPYVTYKCPFLRCLGSRGGGRNASAPLRSSLLPPAALPEPRGEGRTTGYRFSASVPPQPPPETIPGPPRVLGSTAPKGSAT